MAAGKGALLAYLPLSSDGDGQAALRQPDIAMECIDGPLPRGGFDLAQIGCTQVWGERFGVPGLERTNVDHASPFSGAQVLR